MATEKLCSIIYMLSIYNSYCYIIIYSSTFRVYYMLVKFIINIKCQQTYFQSIIQDIEQNTLAVLKKNSSTELI